MNYQSNTTYNITMYSFTLTHCFFSNTPNTIDRGYYMISFIKKVLLTTL